MLKIPDIRSVKLTRHHVKISLLPQVVGNVATCPGAAQDVVLWRAEFGRRQAVDAGVVSTRPPWVSASVATDRRLQEVGAVQWDLGPQGVGLLLAMSFGFGLLARLVAGRKRVTTGWLWLIAAGAFFVGGLLASEVWFGWATEEDLQPNIDGLSFDETLLFGLLAGVVSVVLTRYVTRRGRQHGALRVKPPG